MNKIKGKTINIISLDEISEIKLKLNNTIATIQACDYLIKNSEIFIIFKETEVSIALEPLSLKSIGNRLQTKILKITKGKILSSINLEFSDNIITSIISTKSCLLPDLKEGDYVISLIKSNEISLCEISK